MSNLTKYPLEDGFLTNLSQEWDGNVGLMYLNNVPSFTFPAGITTYMVVNPGTGNIQIAEVDAIDPVARTVNVVSVSTEKGAGITSTSMIHPSNTKVIISDNYQFWSDIATAINSKLDNDGGNVDSSFDIQIPGSAWRVRKDGNDMKFTDDNNAEVTLSTLTGGVGIDRKVAVSIGDTTAGHLEEKLIDGNGITISKNNALADENLEMSVDLTDANIFVTTQGTGGKGLKTDGLGNIDSSFYADETVPGIVSKLTDTEVLDGTEDTKYMTAKQGKLLTIGGDYDVMYELGITYSDASNLVLSNGVGFMNVGTLNSQCYVTFLLPGKDGDSARNLRWDVLDSIELEVRLMPQNAHEDFIIGIHDSSTSLYTPASIGDKAVMHYDTTTSMLLRTADGSSETVSTSLTVQAQGIDTFKLVFDKTEGEVNLYKNGVLEKTSTTNLPQGSGNVQIGIGNVGGIRSIAFDKMTVRIKYA